MERAMKRLGNMGFTTVPDKVSQELSDVKCSADEVPMFMQGRSAVLGRKAMVATSQPLASQIGLRILENGGNAIDAAVAIAATLAVVEPMSTGVGGDCFLLYYHNATRKVYALNGSGRSPQELTLSKAQQVAINGKLNPLDARTVTVPGAVRGWTDAIKRFGSGKFSLADVVEPAACLAEDGFPVCPVTALLWKHGASRLKRSKNCGELLKDGRAPAAGEVFCNSQMAHTLRQVGKGQFYEGPIAEAIVEECRSHGGLLSLSDLLDHRSTWVDPISLDFRGVTLWECPPNGQGLVALIALQILNHLDESLMKYVDGSIGYSPDYIHLLIEILRIAFADATAHIADPEYAETPVANLLSPDHARYLAKKIRLDQTTSSGTPWASSDTISFQTVDSEGNAVSFVNSIYMSFGSGLVPKGGGFALQNRGANFSLDPDHPNVVAPRKRPYHTIIPAMVTKDDKLWATFTNMGGFMQPQGHVQLLLNLIHGMNPQAAVDAPRFCVTADGTVWVEDEEMGVELRRRGHKINVVKNCLQRTIVGRAQIIQQRDVLWGGSDRRADGCAMGF